MNERIKELWIEGTQTSIPREGDYSSVSAKNIEKFAELIVRECADEISKVGSKDLALYLKFHFGVEE